MAARTIYFAAASLLLAWAAPPKVVLTVLVDDLAWANVGYHGTGTPENQTPNLVALAAEGVLLDRHYTHQTCTPSRSAYQTGRLPVHVQTTLANPDVQNSGIPRNMTSIAAKLKQGGFGGVHVVGKWRVI